MVPVSVSAQEQTDHAAPVGRRAASKVTRLARKTTAKSDPAAQAGKAGPDDLEALETENRRLKAVWRSRLQVENAQLREMLARLPSTNPRFGGSN